MKNYLCNKCATHIQQNSSPTTANCPNGGSHSWTNLGEVGINNYQCRKCATTIQSKNAPSSANCPSNGSHSWTKL